MKSATPTSAPSAIPRVSHYGTINIGDLAIDCVVLESGARGYIQKQLMQVFGFARQDRPAQVSRFLADFAPNYLTDKEKTDLLNTVKMPHGGHAKMFPAGILSELPMNVIKAALNGTLHHKQKHIVPHCVAIAEALAKTGEVALIDEATGYQYHREPDALQDFIGRILRESFSDWELRFPPSFYKALFHLYGWEYTGHPHKPQVIGNITNRWVYEIAFPVEIMSELRSRRGKERLHQWLTIEGGIPILTRQRYAVETLAWTSADPADFYSRCAIMFNKPGQLGMVFPIGGAA